MFDGILRTSEWGLEPSLAVECVRRHIAQREKSSAKETADASSVVVRVSRSMYDRSGRDDSGGTSLTGGVNCTLRSEQNIFCGIEKEGGKRQGRSDAACGEPVRRPFAATSTSRLLQTSPITRSLLGHISRTGPSIARSYLTSSSASNTQTEASRTRSRTTTSLGILFTNSGTPPSTLAAGSSRPTPKSERFRTFSPFATHLKPFLTASNPAFHSHPTTNLSPGRSPMDSSVEPTCLVAIQTASSLSPGDSTTPFRASEL